MGLLDNIRRRLSSPIGKSEPYTPYKVNNPTQSKVTGLPVGSTYAEPRTWSGGGNAPPPVSVNVVGGSAGGSQAQKLAEEQARKQAQQQAQEKAQQLKAEQQKKIIVSSQGVRIANSTYVGNQYIPEVKMTASEYKRKIQNQAVSSGQVQSGQQNQYRYEIPREEVQYKQNQQSAQDMLLGGGVTTPFLPTPKEIKDNYGNVVGYDTGKQSVKQEYYITEKPTGESYKNVPATRLVITDSLGNTIRNATTSEYDYYRSQRATENYNQVALSSINQTGIKNLYSSGVHEVKETGILSSITNSYNQVNSGLRTSVTEPAFSYVEKKTGKSAGELAYIGVNKVTPVYLKPIQEAVNIIPGSKEFQISAYNVNLQDVRQNPLKNIVLYAGSYGVGAGIGGIIKGSSYIPKIGQGVAKTTKAGAYLIGGAYTLGYGIKTAKQIYSTPSAKERGAVVGSSALKMAIIGAGISKGMKLPLITEGYIKTIGKTELNIPQGSYPSANPKTHLKLFQKNVIKELGKEPVAFHTTSQKFWKGELTPSGGSSELEGLYVSTQISKEFARLGSSEGSFPKTPKKLLQDFFKIPKPAVAGLKPLGFRYVKAVKVSGGKYPYEFTEPVKSGYIDIPSIKSEIEGVARPGAGKYSFNANDYYVKINNVRVPLDVFKYNLNAELTGGNKVVTDSGAELYGGKSEYSLPPKSIVPSTLAYYSSAKQTIDYVKISKTSIFPTNLKVTPSYTKISKSSQGKSSASSVASSVSNIAKSSSLKSPAKSSLKSPVKNPVSYLYSPPRRSYTPSYPNYYGGSSSGGSSSRNPFKKSSGYLGSKPKSLRNPFGNYLVSVRRFGIWKPYLKTNDLQKAFNSGVKWADRTLGASFKIEGTKKIPKPPSNFYSKMEKGNRIYIEKPKYRLSTGSEVSEIQSYLKKAVKGGRRRRTRRR